jgi:hypothetical protein
MSKLRNQVVVVGTEGGKPTVSKKDNKSAEIIDRAVGGSGAVKVNKTLIDTKSLSSITAIETDWKKFHNSMVSPFKRAPRGCGIIKVSNLTEWESKYREHYRKWEKEVDAFCDNYDSVIEESKIRQGSNFNAGDLPPNREAMRARFKFEKVQPYALENPDDLSFALNDQEIDEIKQEVSNEIMNSIQDSLSESYSTINKLIAALETQNEAVAKGEVHGYHESALDNVREAADALDNLNFTDHEGVNEIQSKMRDMLRGHTAKSTKANGSERNTMLNEAKDIVKKNFSAFGY